MTYRLRFNNLLFLVLLLIICLPTTSQAETPSFALEPGKIEAEIVPGVSLVKQLIITNNLGKKSLFKIEFEDVDPASNSEEGVTLLGSKRGTYSLKDFLLVPDQVVSLESGERKSIPLTISLPTSVAPGSLHGGVFVSPINESINSGPQTLPRLGVLLFVRVAGVRQEAGSLVSFVARRSILFGSKTEEFTLSFNNTGNTYLNPYGLLTITNFLTGQTKSRKVLPWFVLPHSTRKHTITVDNLSGGIYRSKLELNRGYENKIDSRLVWFVILPWWFIIFTVTCFVIGGLILFKKFVLQ